jgi:hypothetical protein
MSRVNDEHVLLGSTHFKFTHDPYKQSELKTHSLPILPDWVPSARHLVFALPTKPLKPILQLPQVFGTNTHSSRFKLSQNTLLADEQLTKLTVVATLFTACTAPSMLLDENEVSRLEVSTV